MDVTKDPDTYVITSVSFGDKPAGNIAISALRKTAEMKKEECPLTARMFMDSTYMDDIIDSVETVAVAKKGTECLKFGGFTVKHWIISDGEKTMIRKPFEGAMPIIRTKKSAWNALGPKL